MTAKPKQLKASEVFAALRRTFPEPAYAVFQELRNQTGFSRQLRTCDALVMGCWPSRGLELAGIEIKVSRGDWLRELAAPEKAEEFSRYCHRWYLAVGDPGIVDPSELPPAWGLLVPSPRGVRLKTAKEAELKKPEPLSVHFLASLMRSMARSYVHRSEIAAELEDRYEKGRAAGEAAGSWAKARLKDLEAVVAEFCEASGVELTRWSQGRQLGLAVKYVLGLTPETIIERFRRDAQCLAARAESLAAKLELPGISSFKETGDD